MTPQEKLKLKAQFLGMNIGANIKIANFVAKLRGVSSNFAFFDYLGDEIDVVKEHGCLGGDCFLNDCKVILRPLSSLTDQEAIGVAVIALDDEIDKTKMDVQRFYPFDDPLKTVIRVNYNDENCAIHFARINYEYILDLQGENNVYNFQIDRVSDYLRGRNFCLPFHGLDPIAEGWAILEETNQPTGAI